MNDHPSISDLRRPLRAVARRIRLQRSLNTATVLGLVGAGLAAVLLTLVKIGALTELAATPWWWVAAALPGLGLLLGALRPVSPLLCAQLLDRSHDLKSRIANAVEFAAQPARKPFEEAAIQDARRLAAQLRPSAAMPLSWPPDLLMTGILLAACLLLALLERPADRVPIIRPPAFDSLVLHQDDIEGFRAELNPILLDPDTDEALRAAAREFNQLLEDLADERLDRAEALRRIAELERELAQQGSLDPEGLRESLRELARDLRSAELTEDAAEALEDGAAADAAQDLNELAEVLRQDPPNRQELERLRRALEQAARRDEEQREQLETMRQQEEELQRLLRREQPENAESEPEQRLLRRRQRELERLQRDREELEQARRRLERLRRELNRAAEGLNDRQQEQAADALDRSAEDLNRMARDQMTEEQRQQLERQMRQLRELIRRLREQQGQGQSQSQPQSGQGGQQQRHQRFVLRAQGQDGDARLLVPGQEGQPGQGQEGQQGQGQQGQGQQGQPGQGQQGQGQQGQPGQTQPGQGQENQGQPQTLMLDPSGQGSQATIEIPGMGQQESDSAQSGGQPGGTGAGDQHDPSSLEDPTHLDSGRRNVRIQGQHGEGPSRSEVIYESARRGFVSRDYQQVHTDYSDHAESVLERDEVPPGYRFYVRRYFQLIRPREEPNHE